MDETIPSIYSFRRVGESSGPTDGGAFSNFLLRIGEVKRIIPPKDKRSRSKRFYEYDVKVQHRENGTAVTKMYHNCYLMNSLAGLADKVRYTLRAVETQGLNAATKPDAGSKVLILCINAEHAQAVIVGGIRHQDDDHDDVAKGHHYEFEFNGANVAVNDDGSWTVTNKGKTAADGKADPKRDKDGAGTTVKVEANGNFQVSTATGQKIVINNKASTIEVSGGKKLTLVADRVNLGSDADEHAVLGDTLQGILEEMIDLSIRQAYMSPVGPTIGPSINAPDWIKIRAKLQKIKSHQTFLKRSPR